jgi:hypothetical protein
MEERLDPMRIAGSLVTGVLFGCGVVAMTFAVVRADAWAVIGAVIFLVAGALMERWL